MKNNCFEEFIIYYKNLNKDEIKKEIVDYGKKCKAFFNNFIYFTPLIMAYADHIVTEDDINFINYLNETIKLRHKPISLEDNVSKLVEKGMHEFNTVIRCSLESYYKAKSKSSREYQKEYFKYVIACLSYKKSINRMELEYLESIGFEGLLNKGLEYDCSNKTSKEPSEIKASNHEKKIETCSKKESKIGNKEANNRTKKKHSILDVPLDKEESIFIDDFYSVYDSDFDDEYYGKPLNRTMSLGDESSISGYGEDNIEEFIYEELSNFCYPRPFAFTYKLNREDGQIQSVVLTHIVWGNDLKILFPDRFSKTKKVLEELTIEALIILVENNNKLIIQNPNKNTKNLNEKTAIITFKDGEEKEVQIATSLNDLKALGIDILKDDFDIPLDKAPFFSIKNWDESFEKYLKEMMDAYDHRVDLTKTKNAELDELHFYHDYEDNLFCPCHWFEEEYFISNPIEAPLCNILNEETDYKLFIAGTNFYGYEQLYTHRIAICKLTNQPNVLSNKFLTPTNTRFFVLYKGDVYYIGIE